MISIESKGDFSKTRNFIQRANEVLQNAKLEQLGQKGVDALRFATPKDSGKTSISWDYRIERTKNSLKIEWTNSNIQNGVNIAILLQYGHGTGGGGYVKGIDYINPAIKPIFDEIQEKVWREVERL